MNRNKGSSDNQPWILCVVISTIICTSGICGLVYMVTNAAISYNICCTDINVASCKIIIGCRGIDSFYTDIDNCLNITQRSPCWLINQMS